MEPFISANPGQCFAVIDSSFGGLYDANTAEVVFGTDQADFLVGYAAAGISETGKVGVFGALPFPSVTEFMDGYALGVDYFNVQHGADVGYWAGTQISSPDCSPSPFRTQALARIT